MAQSNVTFDYTHQQWIGSRSYRDPEDPTEIRRELEWFDDKADAIQFASTPHPAN